MIIAKCRGEHKEIITHLIDIIIHIDVHLAEVIQSYGMWTYLILFIIIFCETGLVVTPFLPGDSLLFVIGALGATGALDFDLVIVLLIIAAITGNSLNYYIGRMIGRRVLERPLNRLYMENRGCPRFYRRKDTERRGQIP
ncbi:MAG: hypothetical protein WC364_08275 [Eubacteriales bacterium]